jgi:nucleoside-diphosphate-sugar epimerase
MKIIITGASGFLGRHLTSYFKAEELITVGRKEATVIAHLEKDIPELPKADLVIHNAGKAHSVPKTAAEAAEFFAVNVQGTRNLLGALSTQDKLPGAFVFISTIAVYGKDTGIYINEKEPLLALDPYGKSKIEAEELVNVWCTAHQIPFAILRLPLIAGTNPPGNLKSMINGIKKGYYFNIAGGKARKSMVLASSVPQAILPAVAAGGIYNLTDGHHPSFEELSEVIALQLGKKKPDSIPGSIATILASIGSLIGKKSPLTKKSYKKMINDLTFDDSKARSAFGWAPLSVIDNFKI